MCLAISYKKGGAAAWDQSQCHLYDVNKESVQQDLELDWYFSHYQRVFYVGPAVLDEVRPCIDHISSQN